MTTSFTLFCEEISNLTAAEKEWVRGKKAEQEHYWDNPGQDETDCPNETDYWADLDGVIFYLGRHVGGEPTALFIESSEDGSVDAAVSFIQEFLREFRPADVVLFEWAETCSRMLPGQFGGGACRITSTNVEWLWTRSRLYE